MSWPIPVFTKIEYPKPIAWRLWLPTLSVIAAGAVGAVLLLWPHGKSTQTLQFWATLIGAPLVACAFVFGAKLDQWEDDQTDAEESEKEQHRLRGMWREWTRRDLCVIDVAAFPAATDEIASFAGAATDLPTNSDRSVMYDWTKNRGTAFRRTRLLHLVARRFADKLRLRKEVLVTLMLDDSSLGQEDAWTNQVMRTFSAFAPGTIFHVEAQSAEGGVDWITRQTDTVDPAMRLVIAAQLWRDGEEQHGFSEGAAAFLIAPGSSHAGVIFRPMTSTRDTREIGLTQIKEYQVPPDRLALAWFTGCEEAESTAIRSALTQDPTDATVERLLDKSLGLPGPASGWIALAIAMEAMRGAGPQLVAWREPESESLHLCTVLPLPQKETTV
ncbi:hypothetical protein BTH42_13520 [Burkholderia sp. SRS-W-2-2016]|uniref:hypothetical protein n=1 Tax=Burkholderia sp. SRS-W-2-2016 TaxID=1926878 RepID=UPI00094AA727|nr:hypothetical protein [Burkholderia sp. SRS-W-2-2016]OLL31212.1 hypothetical protein BTH42_13520 [Burkholderia sp. SRS-W-2-2016]